MKVVIADTSPLNYLVLIGACGSIRGADGSTTED